MARIARIVAPGYPHHITPRGNRRQQIFFNDEDYQAYLEEDWKSFLIKAIDTETIAIFRKHERTGRPIGDNGYIEKVEKLKGRYLKLCKPGAKPKAKD